MSNIRALVLTLSVSALVAGCAEASTSPEAKQPAGLASTPGDSSSHNVLPPSVNVSGQVLAMSATTAAQGSDTLHYTPIGGVPLRIMRNVLVNGSSAQVLAGNTKSDASGNWKLDGLPGGYYVVYAEPEAMSNYAGSYSYIAGTTANVVVNLYVWRKQ